MLNKNTHPLSTGKKAYNYKSAITNLQDTNGGSSFSRKLFTPQIMNNFNAGGQGNAQIISASKN